MMKEQNPGKKLFLIPTLLSPGTSDSVLPCNIREVIRDIDYYFAEDIRSARRFLSELKAGLEIEKLIFCKVDKETGEGEIRSYFKEVPSGKNVGMLSEAGCPCVADPGSVAVSIAHREGWEVLPLVGPSSILMALMASGFNGQSFAFHGYLPIDKEMRVRAIKSLEKESSDKKQTQIFMETPYRNNNLLEDLLKVCHTTTRICIAAELTSQHQTIKTKTISDWKKEVPDLHKKPVIFVLSA